jgi:hypothetical protein
MQNKIVDHVLAIAKEETKLKSFRRDKTYAEIDDSKNEIG